MATATIGQLTLATSALDADLIEFQIASSGLSRRITKANFIGATLTGGGSIATGGFALTVPATGTAALLGTAQTYTAANTFSALQTFSAGISLGAETLSTYDEGTWTPVVADAASAGNVGTPATALGLYTRIGNVVKVDCTLTNIDTTGMTAGNNLHIRGLPFTVKNSSGYIAIGPAYVADVTFTGELIALTTQNVSWVQLRNVVSGGAVVITKVSDLTSGAADITFSLTYLV